MSEGATVGTQVARHMHLQSADGSAFALDALGCPVLLFGMREFT